MISAITGKQPIFKPPVLRLVIPLLTSDPRFYDEHGSMSPDKGLSCTVYERLDCNQGKGGQASDWASLGGVEYPGIPTYQNRSDLQLISMHIKGPMSWRCHTILTDKIRKPPQNS